MNFLSLFCDTLFHYLQWSEYNWANEKEYRSLSNFWWSDQFGKSESYKAHDIKTINPSVGAIDVETFKQITEVIQKEIKLPFKRESFILKIMELNIIKSQNNDDVKAASKLLKANLETNLRFCYYNQINQDSKLLV